MDYIGESKGNVRLPGIMTLGYIGAHSENLAMAVIVSKVCARITFVIHEKIEFSFIILGTHLVKVLVKPVQGLENCC